MALERTILAEGEWCVECGIFEQEQDYDRERCMSCGCDRSTHQAVEVITASKVE